MPRTHGAICRCNDCPFYDCSFLDDMPTIEENRSVHILLVEDHLPDVVLTKRAFSKCELTYTLHVSRDGDQALRFLKRESPFFDSKRPDLILLDINLPKRSGYEVLQEIKKHADLQHIPVIMLTSSTEENDRVRSYQLFANGFLVKPSSLAGFIEMVKYVEGFWFKLAKLKN